MTDEVAPSPEASGTAPGPRNPHPSDQTTRGSREFVGGMVHIELGGRTLGWPMLAAAMPPTSEGHPVYLRGRLHRGHYAYAKRAAVASGRSHSVTLRQGGVTLALRGELTLSAEPPLAEITAHTDEPTWRYIKEAASKEAASRVAVLAAARA